MKRRKNFFLKTKITKTKDIDGAANSKFQKYLIKKNSWFSFE